MGGAQRSVSVRALVPDDAPDAPDDAWVITLDVAWDLTGGADDEVAGDDEETPGDNEVAEDDAAEDDDGAGEAGDEAEGEDGDPGAAGHDWTYTTTAHLAPSEAEDRDWELSWSPALIHPDLETGDTLRLRTEAAERGEILGAGGAVLVTERDVYRIGIDKTRFDGDVSEDDMEDSARALGDLLDVDGEGLAGRVLAAGEKAFIEAITLRAHEAEDVLDEVDAIDGAAALLGTMQLAPTREFARPILGTVGEATAEIIEESGGTVQAGDMVGLSGLQHQYDDVLRGTPGLRVDIVPSEGDPSTVHETEPIAGEDVVTTLDLELQTHAESVLSDVAPASAVVAVHAPTGQVRAAASGPGGGGYPTATVAQYAPGSTFKMVTALALLRAGLTPETTVSCPPTLTVDGREFGNYSAYPDSALGDISLLTAVAESCNTALMGERDQASQQDLADAAVALGMGVDRPVGAPAFLGSVPSEADGTLHAAAMIGQGEILASPLAMATVAASVLAGEAVSPIMVEQPSPESDDQAPDEPLTTEETSQLREMMWAAVDGGTASFLQDVPGGRVGAKTGTAEYVADGEPGLHAWMIAIQDDLAVAVFVEEGESGSSTAGPILEEFLRGI
nr:penicillin-binding transpeptidase domain-containing protein [Phytoactinopolyspora alkaliphila]